MTLITDARVERARAEDLAAVLALLADAKLPDAGVTEHFPAAFVVARGEDGTLLGVSGVERYGGDGLLRSVAVYPKARGTGIGWRLAKAAIGLARESGIGSLYLLTTTAEGYFPRLGFRRIERAEIPASLAASEEMRGACPASAVAMHLRIE